MPTRSQQARCQAFALQVRNSMPTKPAPETGDRLHRLLTAVRNQRRPFASALENLSARVTRWAGGSSAFAIALLIVLVWALTGPLFHFSDSWQLVINTGTTIVTFLMVFLIQTTQNREARAINLKLDELIRSQKRARNIFANLEDATEEELKRFHEEFKHLRQQGLDHVEAAEQATGAARHRH